MNFFPRPTRTWFRLATPLLLLLGGNLLGAEIIGIVEPFLDVSLSAPVPGIITARKFKEGDFVKEGDPVIVLDKRMEELEVERRKVTLDSRRLDYEGTAKVFKTTKGTSKDELEKMEADYKLAEVEHAMAVEQ